ncbi:MAG: phosphatidylglycerol lysyltransferase domain-containing protein [Clostridiales bacterium]|jgi:hypothetical protein|nr:phosphatidylglycerol lysyltransferase domain-containing protein [Clostridiales bacterium]
MDNNKKVSLEFKKIELCARDKIKEIFYRQDYRLCDFTVGGLYMWTDYFDYSYCIRGDTLFIAGNDVTQADEKAFALPVGDAPLEASVGLMLEYAKEHCGGKLNLNCIPEDKIDFFAENYNAEIIEVVDWEDYLYSAKSLATLTGHIYNKKRNRVNLFSRNYENYVFESITPQNIDGVLSFLDKYSENKEDETALAVYENRQTNAIMRDFFSWGFEGAALYVDGKVIGFTAAEIIGDTMFVHIEKADSSFEGAYQTINYLFAKGMLEKYNIEYINREEDVGDSGLRQARLSYNPVKILKKFKVIIRNEKQ